MAPREITAKRKSPCTKCGKMIFPGQKVRYAKGNTPEESVVEHLVCPALGKSSVVIIEKKDTFNKRPSQKMFTSTEVEDILATAISSRRGSESLEEYRQDIAKEAMKKVMERHEKLLAADVAKISWKVADAMLEEKKAREKKP